MGHGSKNDQLKHAIQLRFGNLRNAVSSVFICVGPSGTGKTHTILGDSTAKGLVKLELSNFNLLRVNEIVKIECYEILEKKSDLVKAFIKRGLAKAENARIKKNIQQHKLMDKKNRRTGNERKNYCIKTNNNTENYQLIREIMDMRRTTRMRANNTSSRGHLFQSSTLVKVENQIETNMGGLTIIDMAGFEDYSLSERKEETKLINSHNWAAIFIIKSAVLNKRCTELNNEFTRSLIKLLKESSSTTIWAHSSFNKAAMRSSKFWLNQISSIIEIRNKLATPSEKWENRPVDHQRNYYLSEGNKIEVSYGNDWFWATVISIIIGDYVAFYKVYYKKWSSSWDEWVTESRIKE